MSTDAPRAPQELSADPEVRAEQAYLDRSHLDLVAMRERAQRLLADVRSAGKPDLEYEAALLRRIKALEESRRPLLFGRIDAESGESWRIGRRHVEDAGGDVTVVDWRAPVSVPFYRARPGDPLGLRRRRQIMVEARAVVALGDDLFGLDREDASETRLRGGDALLAELERARTGEMLDIVATIQSEQDEIIRSPLEGLLAVQGGPGTGKTAVALHRSAYLIYNQPELARTGMLVIGPSRAFLRYIAQVLPSLGEEAVLQTTIADLAPRARLRGEDSRDSATIKGDSRMALVLARALASYRLALSEPVTLTARHVAFTFEPAETNGLVTSIAAGRMSYKTGRSVIKERLIRFAREELRARGRYEGDESWFATELSAGRQLSGLVDLLWPSVSPTQLVNDLLSRPAMLEEAARTVLEESEVASLLRPRPNSIGRAPWTIDDVALIDEASFLINGQARTYGHIVVDEAQDLSPMQLRMLARRAPRGSLTVLGDIAQATGPWSYQSWEEILVHLPSSDGVRREELSMGYRAPAQILDLASRLLPVSAPSVRPTSSVRRGRFEPRIEAVERDRLVAVSVAEAHRLADEGFLVGLIVPPGPIESEVAAAVRHDDRVGRLELDGITKRITLLAAPAAKGLEFDAAVVVEPELIAGDSLRGLRLLYVALTRPIQYLSIVHSLGLPALLIGK